MPKVASKRWRLLRFGAQMPRLNGIETARELRKRYADHRPCVVAFFGGNSLDSANTELFDRVLVRPNDTEVLLNLVCHRALNRRNPQKTNHE